MFQLRRPNILAIGRHQKSYPHEISHNFSYHFEDQQLLVKLTSCIIPSQIQNIINSTLSDFFFSMNHKILIILWYLEIKDSWFCILSFPWQDYSSDVLFLFKLILMPQTLFYCTDKDFTIKSKILHTDFFYILFSYLYINIRFNKKMNLFKVSLFISFNLS